MVSKIFRIFFVDSHIISQFRIMKLILQDNSRYVLRFQSGEEVFESSKKFLAEERIDASVFHGLGACRLAELAVYDLASKTYKTKVFEENCEILSLVGNSALLNGQPVLHAHAILGRSDFSTIGGHAAKLVISATCELFLIKLNGVMERKLDEETNLNLLI